MTFADGRMPVSTDMVEFWPADDGSGVRLSCLVCGVSLGTVKYLNEAIKMWTDHQAEKRQQTRTEFDVHNVRILDV